MYKSHLRKRDKNEMQFDMKTFERVREDLEKKVSDMWFNVETKEGEIVGIEDERSGSKNATKTNP